MLSTPVPFFYCRGTNTFSLRSSRVHASGDTKTCSNRIDMEISALHQSNPFKASFCGKGGVICTKFKVNINAGWALLYQFAVVSTSDPGGEMLCPIPSISFELRLLSLVLSLQRGASLWSSCHSWYSEILHRVKLHITLLKMTDLQSKTNLNMRFSRILFVYHQCFFWRASSQWRWSCILVILRQLLVMEKIVKRE